MVACYLLEEVTDSELTTALSGQGNIMASQVLGGRIYPNEESLKLAKSHGHHLQARKLKDDGKWTTNSKVLC